MGSGIAQVAATNGHKVLMYEADNNAVNRSKSNLEKILNRLIEKGKITGDEKTSIQSNIHFVSGLKDLSECKLIIEAIIENLDIKKKVFSDVEIRSMS